MTASIVIAHINAAKSIAEAPTPTSSRRGGMHITIVEIRNASKSTTGQNVLDWPKRCRGRRRDEQREATVKIDRIDGQTYRVRARQQLGRVLSTVVEAQARGTREEALVEVVVVDGHGLDESRHGRHDTALATRMLLLLVLLAATDHGWLATRESLRAAT